MDFRRALQPRTYTPLWINGITVDRVSSFKYLGVHITEDLTWTTHIDTLVRKARQHLYYPRQLMKLRVSPKILQSFYSRAVERIPTGNITPWFGNSTAQDRKALQRGVSLAEPTMVATPTPLVFLEVQNQNLQDHEGSLPPEQRTVHCHAAKSEKLRWSFFSQAIKTEL